jgi:hypothetical protein
MYLFLAKPLLYGNVSSFVEFTRMEIRMSMCWPQFVAKHAPCVSTDMAQSVCWPHGTLDLTSQE